MSSQNLGTTLQGGRCTIRGFGTIRIGRTVRLIQWQKLPPSLKHLNALPRCDKASPAPLPRCAQRRSFSTVRSRRPADHPALSRNNLPVRRTWSRPYSAELVSDFFPSIQVRSLIQRYFGLGSTVNTHRSVSISSKIVPILVRYL